jgi:hypothetical protein
MFPQPGVSQDQMLLANASDNEQGLFQMVLVAENEVHYFCDRASIVRGPVNIEHWHRPGQFTGGEVVSSDIVSVDETSRHTGVDQRVYRDYSLWKPSFLANNPGFLNKLGRNPGFYNE